MTRVHPASLTAGLVAVLLGAWVLADQSWDIGFSFDVLQPALLAAAGLVLLVSGLARRR